MNLEEIILLLYRHRQRATYGAVAAVVGIAAQGIGRRLGRRCPLNSWVVSAHTGSPTGYTAAEMHPDLLAKGHIIRTGPELQAWVHQHQG